MEGRPRMIPRYTRPKMARIFAPEEKLGIWLDVELAAAEAMAALGHVPADAVARLKARVEADRARLNDPSRPVELEDTTRHDVIAFLTHVEEGCGEDARFLHLGLTSSDLLDTPLAIQLQRAADLLLADLDRVLAALEARAIEHKLTPVIGRSHGIKAEPTTFGLKLASFHAELRRDRERLERAKEEVGTCAISGAVGTFATLAPRVEAGVATRFGLVPEPVSTQVIPRDRHAAFVGALAFIASGIERIATEIRHLQRSEVREAEEFFHAGQKGSSAMPHKRNPVLSENLTGLARVVRSAVTPALENVALWHERDISHSSVERFIGPDACILADFALNRLAGMVEQLTVYPEQMEANLESLGGVVHSGEVLLALTRAGISREDAYGIVQRNAMATWQGLGTPGARSFRDNLAADPEVEGRVPAEV